MENLVEKIKEQEMASKPLDVDLNDRKALLQKVGNFAQSFIESLPTTKAFIQKKINTERLKINVETKPIDEILEIFNQEVIESGIKAASGGHIGYIPGGGVYTAALGDFLAAISNEYAGVSYASPGAVAIENEVISWLKSIFSFPKSAVGNLASGGSISNLIALTAARDKYQIKNDTITKSVIYLSEQAHHCIKKALKIIGLEDVIIRYIDLDEQFRIDPENLENRILDDKSIGLNPFLVIASAGTTDVGAIDPLEKMATIAEKYGVWFHVDAAYGGFFILTSKKEQFKGIERADSLVVDPHKGLFMPYGVGAVLIKDAKTALKSNLYTANYMQDAQMDDLTTDPANLSPELTKHFRGLRMWLPLQLHGIQPFKACLEEKLLLTQYFRDKLKDLGFKVGPEPDLSVSYFWYPQHENQDKFNERLMDLIHKDGDVFLSSTRVVDQFVIRIAILSFRTKLHTIDLAIKMIERALKQVLKETYGKEHTKEVH